MSYANAIVGCVLAAAIFGAALAVAQSGMLAMAQESSGVRSYPVDRSVSEMPDEDDFSRPERAYASIHRRIVAGNGDLRSVSAERLRAAMPAPPAAARKMSGRAAAGWLGARIVEVRLVSDSVAYVLARWPRSGSIDLRCFELEQGRWLTTGSQQVDTLDEARRIVAAAAQQQRRDGLVRARKVYPRSYLKPFVDFLDASAGDPKDLVLEILSRYRLVIIGEIHHRPDYWRLNSDVVRDPRFAERGGVVYLELPSNDQALVDRFLDADALDTAPVIEMLRDMLWMGWPDQAMLDFFAAVWNANRKLPPQQRIRIVLVDMQRPWTLIRGREDLAAYEVDRDELMARMVLRDRETSADDPRSALFIVGYGHAAKNLRLRGDDSPIRTAGWHLTQALGEQCFAFMQHGPVISNSGAVHGRIARGLFDSAFREMDYRPLGFALAQSPFGGESFDANADWDCAGLFSDAFDGYLYLKRLEDEFFSPLVDGFYTDEFVRELDRRIRIITGSGLIESMGVEALDGKSFFRWMSRSWGQPRDWRERMGSIDAWQTAAPEEIE